jgi:CBS domain-containing protein
MAQSVREVMTSNPVTVKTSDNAFDAAKRMREADTGIMLVTDAEQHLKGLLTDRDIVVRAIAEGRDPREVSVQEICSSDIETVKPDDDIDRAIAVMRARHVRRVPVCEGDRPVGIVSIGDLAIERDERSALADISSAEPNL